MRENFFMFDKDQSIQYPVSQIKNSYNLIIKQLS